MSPHLIRSQVHWRCHRGMLELDLILLPFFDQQYDQLATSQQQAFMQLLEFSDPQLHAWLLTEERPDDTEISEIVEFIHAKI